MIGKRRKEKVHPDFFFEWSSTCRGSVPSGVGTLFPHMDLRCHKTKGNHLTVNERLLSYFWHS